MCVGFLFLLFFTDTCLNTVNGDDGPEYNSTIDIVLTQNVTGNVTRKCRYKEVLQHLNLTKSNEDYTLTRPVLDHKEPTELWVTIAVYAILDVIEKEQKFISYIWIDIFWYNKLINWDPQKFCGIERISIPTDVVWTPDITIAEMTEKDKAPPSPYLAIYSDGGIYLKNDQVVISTCTMQMYNFPFDKQSCNLTFSSVIHSVEELKLHPWDDSKTATNLSHELIRTQDEWVFLNLTVNHAIDNSTGEPRGQIIFTISMKRRPVLYIVNFLLPLLFFLCLDIGSFLISDGGGEKLSFKVTVLLAVTVLQLILNDILPTTSNKVPLIASYCIVIFGLMLLSLLETILVTYLIEKDSLQQENEADRDRDHSLTEDSVSNFHNCDKEAKKWTHCPCICDVSGSNTPCELLPVPEEGSSSKPTSESHGIALILEELREMEKTLTLFFNNNKKRGAPGYWTRVAKIINRTFFICYSITIIVFLGYIFGKWSNA